MTTVRIEPPSCSRRVNAKRRPVDAVDAPLSMRGPRSPPTVDGPGAMPIAPAVVPRGPIASCPEQSHRYQNEHFRFEPQPARARRGGRPHRENARRERRDTDSEQGAGEIAPRPPERLGKKFSIVEADRRKTFRARQSTFERGARSTDRWRTSLCERGHRASAQSPVACASTAFRHRELTTSPGWRLNTELSGSESSCVRKVSRFYAWGEPYDVSVAETPTFGSSSNDSGKMRREQWGRRGRR